jgi:hypothetical protein
MKYKVKWEVSKYAIIEAESEEEAIEKLHNADQAKDFEDEITSPPEAFIINE